MSRQLNNNGGEDRRTGWGINDSAAPILRLPQVENGVLTIGDLWDAGSSTRPGFNIFGNAFHDGQDLKFQPIGRMESKTFHNKDTESALQDLNMNLSLTAELSGGFIKIEGGLEFQLMLGHGFDNEMVNWHFSVDNHGARLPSGSALELQRYLDRHVRRKVEDKTIKATHYVSEVILGGEATGSISIRQTNTSTKYRVKLFLEGKINLGPLGAELGASAEVSEDVHVANYETIITLASAPVIQAPTNLAQFERLGGKMSEEMAKTVFFVGKPTYKGLPKLFVLSPIEELLTSPSAGEPAEAPMPMARSLGSFEDGSDQEFISAICLLRDLRSPDYCKRLLLEDRPLLYKIISDPRHWLAQDIEAHESEIIASAERFNRSIYDVYSRWKYDDSLWESEMIPILREYEAEPLFKQELLAEKIKGWISDGNTLLELVNLNHEDDTSPLHLFSTDAELENWLITERTVKIVLYTKTKEELLLALALARPEKFGKTASASAVNFEQIANFPFMLQKLSKALGNLGGEVGIAYPSVSPPQPSLAGEVGATAAATANELVLRMKTRLNSSTLYVGEEEIEFFIHILEALTGYRGNAEVEGQKQEQKEDSPAARNIQHLRLYNQYTEQLGISLPLAKRVQRPHSFRQRVFDMSMSMSIENTPQLLTFLSTYLRHVRIYHDKASFGAGGAPPHDRRWRFVATVETLESICQALQALELLRLQLVGAGGYGGAAGDDGGPEFAICNFELASADSNSPLLFIFQGTSLEAICSDSLDLLVLLHHFQKSPPTPLQETAAEGELELLKPTTMYKYSISPLPRLKYGKLLATSFGLIIPDYSLTNSPIHSELSSSNDEDGRLALWRQLAGQALQITKCILDEPSSRLTSFPTVLVHMIRDDFYGVGETSAEIAPAFEELLQAVRSRWWSMANEKVVVGYWNQMLNDLNSFLLKHYPYLSLLQTAMLFLKGLAADPLPIPVDEDEDELVDPLPEPENPELRQESVDVDAQNEKEGEREDDEEPVLDFEQLLAAIQANEECTAELRTEINYFLQAAPHYRVQARLLAQYAQIELAHVLLTTEKGKAFTHFLQLLQLIDAVKYTDVLPRETQERLVTEFILPLFTAIGDGEGRNGNGYGANSNRNPVLLNFYAESQIELSLSLSTKSYSTLITILSSCALNPTQHVLMNALSKITSFDDGKQLVKLLQTISKYFHSFTNEAEVAAAAPAQEQEVNFWSYIWKNPKFYALMYWHISNPSLLNAIIAYQFLKPNVIPKFIPKPFIGPLRQLMANIGGDDSSFGESDLYFSWDWPNLAVALEAFQYIWMKRKIPAQFPKLLLRNMLKYDQFRDELVEAAAAAPTALSIFWSEELGYFEQVWDLDILYKCIEASLVAEEKKNSSKSANNWRVTARKSPAVMELALKPRRTRPMKLKEGPSRQEESVIDVSTIWRARPFREQGEDMSSRSSTYSYLVHWFQKLQFGSRTLWDPDDECDWNVYKHLDVPQLSRFMTIVEFVNWAFSSTIALRQMASFLAKYPYAIPLIVPSLNNGSGNGRLEPSEQKFKILLSAFHRLPVTVELPAQVRTERELQPLPQQLLLFQHPFRMITVISIGEERKGLDTAWLLNKFLLKEKGDAFSSGYPHPAAPEITAGAGYTEFIWLDSNSSTTEELTLLVNVNGNAMEQPAIVQWLQQYTTRFIIFWMCEQWTWSEFKTTRQSFIDEILSGGDDSSILDLCVNPSMEIKEAAATVDGNRKLLLSLDTEPTDEIGQKIERAFETALKCQRRGVTLLEEDLESSPSQGALPIPLLQQLEHHVLPTPIKQYATTLVKLVEAESVKGLKMSFLPLREEITELELENHWRSNPGYSELITLFYGLLVSEKSLNMNMAQGQGRARAGVQEQKHGEGLMYLEQLLSTLSNSAEEVRLLYDQKAKLASLLENESSLERKEELSSMLARVTYKIDHEQSITVEQLQNQLLRIHQTCPHLLLLGGEGETSETESVPLLMASTFLQSIPIELPTSAQEVIAQQEELWFTEFLAEIQASFEFGQLNSLYVISLVGTEVKGFDKALIFNLLFASHKACGRGRVIQNPHSSLNLRLVYLSAEFQEEVFKSTGSPYQAILLVNSPNLAAAAALDAEVQKGGAIAERKLLSLLLATSHLTMLCGGDASDNKAKSATTSLSDMLEIAFIKRLMLPTGLSAQLPPPNLIFICDEEVEGKGNSSGNKFDLPLILENVKSLVETQRVDSGTETDFTAAYWMLESSMTASTSNVIHPLPLSTLCNHDLVHLHNSILHLLLSTETPGLSFKAWLECLTNVSNNMSSGEPTLPITVGNSSAVSADLELRAKLRLLGSHITTATEYHMLGYVQHIYDQMEQIYMEEEDEALTEKRAANAKVISRNSFQQQLIRFADNAQEDVPSPNLVKANIRDWVVTKLDGVYKTCEFGEGENSCEYCKFASDLEDDLLAHYGIELKERIGEVATTYTSNARLAVHQRLEQVMTCYELKFNTSDLLAEFEMERQLQFEEHKLFTSRQFLSTKNTIVPTWRRFIGEMSGIYTCGFMDYLAIDSALAFPWSFEEEEELIRLELDSLQGYPAYENGLDGDDFDDDANKLTWEEFELISSGLKNLSEQILVPNSIVLETFHYCNGNVNELHKRVNAIIILLINTHAHGTGMYKERRFKPSFLWEIHVLALKRFWQHIRNMEEEDWTSRYNPLKYSLHD